MLCSNPLSGDVLPLLLLPALESPHEDSAAAAVSATAAAAGGIWFSVSWPLVVLEEFGGNGVTEDGRLTGPMKNCGSYRIFNLWVLNAKYLY